MEREKRKEEIEKDYLKVKRYLIEDEKPPKYTSVIKNIELYLKSIKSQQSTFIEYIYKRYCELSSIYNNPNNLFDSPYMYYVPERWQTSTMTRYNYEQSKLQIENSSNKGNSNMFDYKTQYRLYQHKIMLPANIDFPCGKYDIHSFERKVTPENIKLYNVLVKIDKNRKKQCNRFLENLKKRIISLNIKYNMERSLMSFPVIEFIQIETHWNKNNLKTVYDKLVEKGFIEPNKGESFVSFFLGYDEVNDIQAIKWYKTPSNHNFSAIEFLLIGLKALDQLGEYVIKFNLITAQHLQIKEQKRTLELIKKEQREGSKMEIGGKLLKRYTQEHKLESKRIEIEDKIGGIEDRIKSWEDIVLTIPSFYADRKRMLKLFVDKEENVIKPDYLRIRKENMTFLVDIYEVLKNALGNPPAY